MNYQSLALGTLLSATVLVGLSAPSHADPLAPATESLQVKVGGRMNVGGVAEQLQNDVSRSYGRIYLFQKNARLDVTAQQGDYKLYAQEALGGEDVYTTNTNLTLLDMYAQGPLGTNVTWRVGQQKVPYGRELMTDGGHLAFNDRSVESQGFLVGRDVGAALQENLGPVTAIEGVFTGGGRDVPQRYLPEIMGIPMLTARIGIGDANPDAFTFSQHAFDTKATHQGFAIDGLYTYDSKVGHSTVLNVKDSFERSLLIDPNWNPYLGNTKVQGDLWQAGLDYALHTPVSGGVLSAEAEANYGQYNNGANQLNLTGGRAQAAYNFNPFEVALRYSVLFPDTRMAYTDATTKKTYPILDSAAPIHEITPAVSYFLMGDRLKLTVDFPMYLNMPIANEPGIGSYLLTEEPGETSLAKNAGAITRQFVFEARGGLQYSF